MQEGAYLLGSCGANWRLHHNVSSRRLSRSALWCAACFPMRFFLPADLQESLRVFYDHIIGWQIRVEENLSNILLLG